MPKCKLCYKQYGSKCSAKLHIMKKHWSDIYGLTDVNPLAQCFCGMMFETNTALNAHINLFMNRSQYNTRTGTGNDYETESHLLRDCEAIRDYHGMCYGADYEILNDYVVND